jgi:CHAT domain-containing protein
VQRWIADGLLPADTVVVDLVVEDDGLAAHLVWEGGATAVAASGAPDALADVERGDVDERQHRLVRTGLDDPLLQALAQAVDAAVTAARPTGATLVLVPDGPLHNLPVHVTRVGAGSWCDHRRIGHSAAVGALPFFAAPRPATGRALVAGDSSRAHPLPAAAAECHAVAGLLGATGLVGPDACHRASLVTALQAGAHDVVHLAVHGRGDPRNGGRASLLVGEADWMPFDELAALPWTSRLVVFSGCSTAVAGPRNGRDFLDVATAAAQAGAAAVLACLWPIRDDAARVFMEAFHSWWAPRRGVRADLREGLDHARSSLRIWLAASAQAEPDARRDGRSISAHPPAGPASDLPADVAAAVDWAPFILLGDPYAATERT